MSAPVWQLSVNLETRTATFQTGMADAAKAARSSFSEIKSGADEMGRATGGSMMEARHGVMLLGDEFGIHLPRGLTMFISSLGPVGAAMEAAFPFLAIIVGATLLLQHLAKLKQEGQELTASQAAFGHTVANVLGALDEKLLRAGIRADELNGDHLGALHKTLELIDHQSLAELERSFDEVAKSADVSMAKLKTSWYQFGAGAAGAENALDDFKRKYEALLDSKDTDGAHNLLSGTLQTAQHVLDLQKQAADNQTKTGTGGTHQGDYAKYEQAKNALKQQGIGFTEKEIDAQETLVHALNAQVDVESKVAALKKLDANNAKHTEANQGDRDEDKVARVNAQTEKQMAEEAQKLAEENYRRAVEGLQENERQKIDATREGSTARLAAIDSAIKEEESKGLQETGFYRGLLTTRVQLTRQMAEEQAKLTAEAGKIDAEHTEKMGQLTIQAEREKAQTSIAELRMSIQQKASEQLKFAKEEYDNQLDANKREQAALDAGDKNYTNKLKALQDKQLEMTRAFENEKAQITEKAEQEKAQRVIEAENRMGAAIASTAAHSIVAGKGMGQALAQVGKQMLQDSLTNLMQLETIQGRKRLGDARTAAADAFADAGNPLLGAIEGALAFAAVMAFETGGIVPGVTKGDTVPAMLTPGEAVLPKRLTENLTHASRSGSSGQEIHIHHHATYHVQSLDSDGVDKVLEKHGEKFNQHAENHIRKMNH